MLLKKGMTAWNAWRNEDPDIRPDLGNADLRGANLVGTDLRMADLRGARLAGADLRKADVADVDLTGVRLLANLSHFVIVDISNPRSTPLELQASVPDYMVPFVPILEQGQEPFAMFVDLQNKYDWVLKPIISYSSVDRLIEVLKDEIVRPAEKKFNELLARRTEQLVVKNI